MHVVLHLQHIITISIIITITITYCIAKRFYSPKSEYKSGRNPTTFSFCRFMTPSHIDTKSGSTLQQLVLVAISVWCLDGFDSTHGSPGTTASDRQRMSPPFYWTKVAPTGYGIEVPVCSLNSTWLVTSRTCRARRDEHVEPCLFQHGRQRRSSSARVYKLKSFVLWICINLRNNFWKR